MIMRWKHFFIGVAIALTGMLVFSSLAVAKDGFPPMLTSFIPSATYVEVGNNGGYIDVQVTATDLSGVGHVTVFVSDGTFNNTYGVPLTATSVGKSRSSYIVWKGRINWSAGVPTQVAQFSVFVSDLLGNGKVYTPLELQELGYPHEIEIVSSWTDLVCYPPELPPLNPPK